MAPSKWALEVPCPEHRERPAKGAVYVPSPEAIERSNVTRFMRAHGVANYRELVQKSANEPEWFWGAVEREIGVKWVRPYDKVLDESKGPMFPQWFVGGRLNLGANLLDRWVEAGLGDAPAVRFEREDGRRGVWSYRELQRQVNPLCKLLRGLGVKPGDAVGVFLPMVPETVAALIAIAKVAAVFVPLFSGFGADAIAARLNDCQARVLITADGFRRRGHVVNMKDTADEAASRVPTLMNIVCLRQERNEVKWNSARDVDWRIGICPFDDEFVAVPVDSEHPFMIIYTSGTTGRPKGAVHVHGGFLVKIAQEVLHQGDYHRGEVLYWFTDMGWIMGPWEVVGTLALGGTLLVFDGAPDFPGPDRLWSLIESHKVSFLGISPTLIRALMKHGEAPLKAHDLTSLRAIGSTGETWNPDPWMWCFNHVGGGRAPIINLSGGTEVGACFLSALTILPLKPCTLGGPALGMAVDVVDEDGDLLRGGVGELVCRRPWPSQTRGLYKANDRYLETYWSRFKEIWYHGDFASVDEDGYWFLHGRSDDTIKIAGKRLGPAEVESILTAHPAVRESAAVGIADATKGEVLWGFVILRPGHAWSAQLEGELTARVEKELGRPYRPAAIIAVADLPKTRNAKILRRAIRSAVTGAAAGDLTSLENPAAVEAIREAAAARRR